MIMLLIWMLIDIWSAGEYDILQKIVCSLLLFIVTIVGGFFTLCILAAMDVPLDTPIFVSNQQTFDKINITYDPKKNNEIQRIEGVTTLYEKEDSAPDQSVKAIPENPYETTSHRKVAFDVYEGDSYKTFSVEKLKP